MLLSGNLVKVMGWRVGETDRDFLMKMRWWEKGQDWIKSHVKWFDDVKILQSQIKKEGGN